MKRKDENGSVAVRLSLAAGILLVLLAGETDAHDPTNRYSEYNIFLRDIEQMILDIKEETDDYTTTFDVLSLYYTYALLALGSSDDTRREIMANYLSTDRVFSGVALLNETVPTYNEFSLESYINLSENLELASDFDRILTEDIPLVVITYSDDRCKKAEQCTTRHYLESDPKGEKQQVCFASYSDYKADWAKQFDPKKTSKMTFNTFDGSVRDITMMSRTGLALYKEDNNQFKMQMLTIPFASKDSVLILMKPNDGTRISTFGKRVYSDFDNLIKNVIYKQEPTNVKIRLPKFKVTSLFDFMLTLPFENILVRGATTSILKKYPNTSIKYFLTNIEIEVNEEGINYNSMTVAGNVKCEEALHNVNPVRETPTLKKSHVQSPFAIPEIVSLVAAVADEKLKPTSRTVEEFSGDVPFLYMVLTTDLTILTVGEYYGN